MKHEISHRISESDHEFLTAFEAAAIAPANFNHRAHVRLAYIYLATNDVERGTTLMRHAIVNFLRHHGIAPTKYHETLTQAWILAVFHFMHRTTEAASADEFIERTPILLDSRIMMSHYSAERLFSQHARHGFVQPDLDAIPRHQAA